jgi:hypothetical protein
MADQKQRERERERERGTGRGQGQDIPKQLSPVTYVLQLGHTLETFHNLSKQNH